MVAWWWVAVSLSAGALLGFFLAACLAVSARGDERAEKRGPGAVGGAG